MIGAFEFVRLVWCDVAVHVTHPPHLIAVTGHLAQDHAGRFGFAKRQVLISERNVCRPVQDGIGADIETRLDLFDVHQRVISV